MIWEFPKTRWKTVDVETNEHYRHSKTIITRRPWLRIIWGPAQKTVLLGAYRVNFTHEPDAAEHMDAVDKAAGDAHARREHTG